MTKKVFYYQKFSFYRPAFKKAIRGYKRDRFNKVRYYKYELKHNVCANIGIKPDEALIVKNYISLNQEGFLQIREKYSWDGASVVRDTHSNMFASLVHDALYQLMRESNCNNLRSGNIGGINRDHFRKKADDLFRAHWKENKGWRWWVAICHKFLGWFGKKHTLCSYSREKRGDWLIEWKKSYYSPAEGSAPCPKDKGGAKKKTTSKRKKALKSQTKSRGS